jgi:hypothetical protein
VNVPYIPPRGTMEHRVFWREKLDEAYELVDALAELGQDYSVYQSAQAANTALRKAKRALRDAQIAF